ncbi:MAG: KpsF/GutQ family sugar-phosphate isomerase [Synechococcus sp. TMED169]|jgi:arabinose-5-phosphate isomerase|nr:MAG: KpsF/GutQ family sugar-phosphate isomerase [Synechococcus sp. TMED169]
MNPLAPVLQQEAQALLNTAKQLRPDQAEAALDCLQRCSEQGAKLVVTGVGKSGIVARKIAATFTSIGLMAIYLNPLDALHGDLGVVGSDDVVFLLSNSGESPELLALLPHLHRRGSACIGLTGRPNSSLAKGCQVVLDGSVDREVCPLNLAPTASTAVAMAIGDALAAVWMQRQGVTPADFAVNHPAGSLGRQLTLSVADLMVPIDACPSLQADAALADVVDHLTGTLAGAAWVQRPDQPKRLLGLITDGDLRRALRMHPPQDWAVIQASNLMTTDPITVAPDQLAVAALELMERNRRKAISVLPVEAINGELVGLLRLHDLVQAGLSRPAAKTAGMVQAA